MIQTHGEIRSLIVCYTTSGLTKKNQVVTGVVYYVGVHWLRQRRWMERVKMIKAFDEQGADMNGFGPGPWPFLYLYQDLNSCEA
jgi:hypothetical protein